MAPHRTLHCPICGGPLRRRAQTTSKAVAWQAQLTLVSEVPRGAGDEWAGLQLASNALPLPEGYVFPSGHPAVDDPRRSVHVHDACLGIARRAMDDRPLWDVLRSRCEVVMADAEYEEIRALSCLLPSNAGVLDGERGDGHWVRISYSAVRRTVELLTSLFG
jgi:hypothetical protein